ncbi:MAG: tripartite tricarboxylate transporter TctB family protein [Rubrivivax sp.]|nr:tripartite tricarboxylate transporter TctB family protein [Rubrivivax sp.]
MTNDDPSPGAAAGRPLARNSTVDLFVAACLAVAGAVVIVEARRLGATWQSDGPGAGYFPFYIGLILAVCGVALFVQALNARKSDDSVFVDTVQLRQVLSVLGPSVLYVAVTVLLGIYIASALFIALFMIVLGRYAVLKSGVVGVAIGALFFLMFEVWFKVPLYKGLLQPLAFLGY